MNDMNEKNASQQKPDRVDAVLAALRTTEPAAGIEDRVLARLQAAEQGRAAASAHQAGGRGLLIASAFTLMLAAVLVAAYVGRQAAPSAGGPRQGQPTRAVNTAEPAQASTVQRASNRPHPMRHRDAPSEMQMQAAEHSRPVQETAGARHFGYPPPALPLSAQEQLLLRVVHQGDPDQLAALDAKARENELYAEQAQFEEFFFPASPAPTTRSEAPPQTPQPPSAPNGDRP